MFFRKRFLPWTASQCFDSEDAFLSWLAGCHTKFNNWRMICLFPAMICLLAGYILDRRPIMLLTVIPLLLVLLLSIGLDRIEKTLNGQNKSD